MFAKLYDRVILFFVLIIISPLIILTFIAVAVGYPLHLIRRKIWSALTQSRSKVSP